MIKPYREELVIFLAEKEYGTLEQLGQVADRFEEAHSRWEPRKGKTGPTMVKDQGLMVGRETAMEKLALTNIIPQMPRRPLVG